MKRVAAIPGFGNGWAWRTSSNATFGVWWQTYSSGTYTKGAPQRAVFRVYLGRAKAEFDMPWGIVR